MVDLLCTFTNSAAREAEALSTFRKHQTCCINCDTSATLPQRDHLRVATWYSAHTTSTRLPTLRNLHVWPQLKAPEPPGLQFVIAELTSSQPETTFQKVSEFKCF